MARYATYRVLQAFVVIWIVATLVFVIVRLTPGDAAFQVAGPDASRETVALIRAQLGLNDSLPEQYVRYLSRVVRGDFQQSLRFGDPAMSIVIDRIPNTMRLAGLALFISVSLGGLVGILSAVRPGGLTDQLGKAFVIVGQSMPSFLIGILVVLIFAVKLRLLPAAGTGSWKHFVLPAATLGWFSMAAVTRLTRSAMLDVLETDYVKFLRIKGLPTRTIVLKHALRNASLPILTLVAIQLTTFLSGSVVVESIFAWPGVGRLMTDSVTARDYTVIQAATFVISATLVTVNLLVDLCYAYIDPRIRYS
jgi:ABC-type dipeptide/oligopeptide/nickel transport system permease component